jgi:DNA mismatch repair protein MutS
MNVPARDEPVWKTPLFGQYWKLKDEAPDCLLFFRLGDFYELFGEDAVRAAPLLEVQLTTRDRNSPTPVPMCGVPAHAVDSYAERLLKRGFHVALAEQLGTPADVTGKAKIVERGIIRILTPGLPVDFGRIDAKSPHWFCALGLPSDLKVRARSRAPEMLEVLAYDFLGGTLFEGTVDSSEALEDLLRRLDPKEILLPTQLAGSAAWKPLAEGSAWAARLTPWAGVLARENLESYLLHTQRCDRDGLRNLLPDAQDLRFLLGARAGDGAEMPANVFEHWAVFPDLFELFDRCGSAVGARRLKTLLANPLKNPARIARRQQAFAALTPASERILERSREVYDLERLLGRFRVGVANPRELTRFALSLAAALDVVAEPVLGEGPWHAFTHDEALPELTDLRAQLGDLAGTLSAALRTDIDAAKTETLADLLQEGFDANFDELKNARTGMEAWLAAYEEELRARAGIASLKVRYNRVFGHYIEVTKTHAARVPADFERKQTTVNGERFTTAVLRQKESEILTAGARAEAKAREICDGLRAAVVSRDESLRALIAHFSWADAVAGTLAAIRGLGRFGPWTNPEVLEGDFRFRLEEARHPILERLLNGSFTANSVELGGPGQRRCLVLTGPNMAGKSTLMRQTGLCLLLAQCGLAVPATRMSFAPCSGFYSRMGATDRILSGESTFMVEMKETAAILRSADAQSFILLDEIGRGTSTEDGLAIAQAVLEFIHDELGALAIFATHYHELAEVAARLPLAANASMGIREWKGDLVFLRTLELKPAESSYGIFVAKMAGLPRRLIKRSEDLFGARGGEDLAADQLGLFSQGAAPASRPAWDEVEDDGEEAGILRQAACVGKAPSSAALASSLSAPEFEELGRLRTLAARWGEFESRLRAIDPDELSPRDAWARLSELRQGIVTDS